MIHENSLIASLIKNHIDKATIKLILADLSDEIEWDTEMIDICAEHRILDVAFEFLDKNAIIELIIGGQLAEYKEEGLISDNISFPKGTFDNITDDKIIYNLLTTLFNMNLNGNELSPGGFYEDLCIEEYDDGSNFEYIGGRNMLISMLETYGHLNGWYRSTFDSENYGRFARFYRNESEVVGYFKSCETTTIQDICKDTDLNPIEIQTYLQNEFNEKYELNDHLDDKEIIKLALEFNIFYKL